MRAHIRGASVCALVALAACGDDDGAVTPDAGSDVTTDRCTYEPLAPTTGAGGTVAAGALTAGAAEVVLDVPVGTALGGYTGRAASMSDAIDGRDRAISDGFQATVGVETAPRAKALALAARRS
jgi:neutral ceramidase